MSALPELRSVVEQARDVGFLGPGPVESHLRHAEGFAIAAEDALGRRPANFADLGTGGGVPGLVLAVRWPDCAGILIEVGRRRAAFLRSAVSELSLDRRIEVVEERGEAVGRSEATREHFELVTARSFAAPAVTAEIGAGLVRASGLLIVSEPPDSAAVRWPTAPLTDLGFEPGEIVEVGGAHFAVLRKSGRTPDGYPRAVGRPTKRPLW